jgi:3-methyladenine DNA glycosylase AlkD
LKLKRFSAQDYVKELQTYLSDDSAQKKASFYEDGGKKANVLGVRMKVVFDLARKYRQMPLTEINELLDSELYEARLGAVSIMDFKTREKGITETERKALFDMYIERHDRINNWGLVDRSAPRVVGWYLQDKPRDILYTLANSDRVSERRTAIVAPLWFVTRQSDVDDALSIAEVLVNDKEELINTALGATLHYVGVVDKDKLEGFLDKHYRTMPKITLRLAIRKQDVLKSKYKRP